MREFTAPIALVVKRIAKEILEAVYGLSIKFKTIEEGGDGKITGQDLLIAYASKSCRVNQLIGSDAFQSHAVICVQVRAIQTKLGLLVIS